MRTPRPSPVRPDTARKHERPASVAPPPTTEELEFVHGIVHQQPAAVVELFDRYAALVRRTLVRTLGNAVDLDDLTQDTFITVIRRAHTLRDPCALRSFVVSVAVRTARNELRKRAIRRFVGLEDASSLPVAGPLDAALVEGVRHIYDALARLSTEARLAFVLRHVEGYELTETAAACGCSLATIKRRLSRAESRFEAIANGDPTLREFLEQARRQS